MAPLTRLQRRNQSAALQLLGMELRGGRRLPPALPPAAPLALPPPAIRRKVQFANPRELDAGAQFSLGDSQDFNFRDVPQDILATQRERRDLRRYVDAGIDPEVMRYIYYMDEEDPYQGLNRDRGMDLLGRDIENYSAPDMIGDDGEFQQLPDEPDLGYYLHAHLDHEFSEGNVPIVNVSVDVDVTDLVRYPPEEATIVLMHARALTAAHNLVGARIGMQGLYGQVRLSADSNPQMRYDLTTPMVRLDELQDAFETALHEALQSNSAIGSDVSNLRFKFTIVAPNGNINVALVNRTSRVFADTASNPRQRRVSQAEARERFIRLRQWREDNPGRPVGEFIHNSSVARRDKRRKAKPRAGTKARAGARIANFLFRRIRQRNAFVNPFGDQSFDSQAERALLGGSEFDRAPYDEKDERDLYDTKEDEPPRRIRQNLSDTRASARPVAGLTLDDLVQPPKRGSGSKKRERRPRTAAEKERYNTNKKAKRTLEKVGKPRAATQIQARARGFLVRARNRARQRALRNSQASASSFPLSYDSIFGIYDSMKRKIFHHTALDEFFLHSKAVLEVPNTHTEGYCLAMAFIRSQARFYDLKTGDIREALVSNQVSDADVDDPHCLLVTLPILPRYVVFLCGDKPYPFLKYNEAAQETEGVLFNPYRTRQAANKTPLARGGMKYQNVLDKDEIQAWYRLAQNFHEYVTCVINESFPDIQQIDPNKEETLQYYSDVTQTIICVYRLELQGKRTRVFVPFNYPKDLRQQGGIRVVSILINESHATAITNLRDFVQNKDTANRTTINGYCVCCERICTANNETKAASKHHFLKCLETNQGELKSAHKSMLRRQQVASYSAPQFVFNFKSRHYTCRTCNQEIDSGIMGQMKHVCRVQFADIKFGEEADLYVYDMECAQVLQETEGQSPCFIHEVNLVCVRRVYPDANGDVDRHAFATLESFMKYVLSMTDKNRIYIAHNGGRYDVQFVMQYIEANLIPHTFIPTPASIHAYLSVTIPFGAKLKATFLDFRNFMPGSLKGIGTSFGLSVAKGDFPHRFNNGFNDEYEGSLPPIDHEDDYWCLSTKRTAEDVAEFKAFYDEQKTLFCTCGSVCNCMLPKWHFYGELLKYCWLDVDVLAEACAKYRNNAMDFGVSKEAVDQNEWVSNGIDPFQYLTIPQLAVNLLLNGMPEDTNLTITPMKSRKERHVLAVPWMERMNKRIIHIGNSNREFFCFATKRYIDGIDEETNELYVCLDCQFHGCRRCFFNEFETGADHPTRPATYSRVHRDTEEFVETLLKTYGVALVHIVWSHELEERSFSSYEIQLGNIMKERDMFYGGRTEVFSPYINADFYPDDDLQYHDVCSLYPYVCAFKTLPTGNPEHICGVHIDRDRILDLCHPAPYFGYVRAHVTPHPKCLIGLLPYRCPDSGRLEFPLTPMVGSWGTEELRIAIENGYVVDEIYEVYHWDETERSDKLLRGYVSYFLQMKQEAEGWVKMGASSETPSMEEQLEIQQKVFEQSGYIGKIRPECVQKNPVKRQMAKLFLNSLWGKFCQKPNKDHFVVIHGYQQFASLWYDPSIDKSKFSFRHISNQTWKVKFSSHDSYAKTNPKYNIFLASKVTEEARCILHRQMLKIGPERILYCDTDSIMFVYPKEAPRLEGVGLGNWVNEYPKDKIKRIFALAPKFYFMQFDDGETLLKSKGIQMTLTNSQRIHAEGLGLQLMESLFPYYEEGREERRPFQGFLQMSNMIMGVNSTNSRLSYGQMLTRYTEDKKVRPVISKRQLVTHWRKNFEYTKDTIYTLPRIYTVPHGYYLTVEEVSRSVYN